MPDEGPLQKGKGATGEAMRATSQREHEPIPDMVAGSRRTTSAPLHVAAEIARLEAELERLRARIEELEAYADRDPLTEVMNRRGFERELRRASAYVKRYGGNAALVYLDLDSFKQVNDAHGHAAGDAVLKAVAAALVREVRASDTVARLGGDEFAALLWNVAAPAALAKADALERAVLSTSVTWGGARLSVGASAGVVDLTGPENSGDVLSRADAAMYARKRVRQAPST